MEIDRCYCFQTSFAELKAMAKKTGASTVAELQEHVLFGENCGLCHPYVRRMLHTGNTTFEQVILKRDKPMPPQSSPCDD